MWKYKLAMNASPQFCIPIADQIRLYKRIGFEGFFLEYQHTEEWRKNIAEWRKIADEEGMIFQSIHAPFSLMRAIWSTEPDADEAVEQLIGCVRTCAENKVPIMVAHTFIGFDDHTPTEVGLENFAKIVAEAEKLGVKVAFENVEGEEYLAAVMERFKDSPAVGFCWDTGHEMCYNHSKDMLALYGDRLIATHINDNLGIRSFDGVITWRDDLHLLPFDGIGDWQDIASRLDRCGFDDIMSFELSCFSKPERIDNKQYENISFEEYVAMAYARACRVATLRKGYKK